ncbi:MAG: Zn-dependent hydrolase [Candidatus Eiseniibacteriota bacterium]
MNRRDFNRSVLGPLGAAMLPTPLLDAAAAPLVTADPEINAARLMEQLLQRLAQFGRNPEGGVSRVAYSEADRQGREYVTGLMREAQLEVSVDAAGNLLGRRAGREPRLPALAFGSHIDSVPNGGNYDGPVGSLGAIEVARTLAENRIVTRHPLLVTIFANEEGGLYGSRAITTGLPPNELDDTSSSGKTIREGIRFIGGDPDKLDGARLKKGDVAAYVELHIEQGGNLEREKLDIGVVEGIVGIKQWAVVFEGFANHAGTTPMDRRQDALISAAKYVQLVNRVVRAEPGRGRQVGTVGRIQAFPGAPNVIPGRVEATLELRDLDDGKVTRLAETIMAEARKIADADGTKVRFRMLHENIAAPTDPRVRGPIAEAARAMGLSTKVMPSGAGHDAQAMAQIAPVGIIFIPSIGGISHSPKEFSRAEDIANGANVLLGTILRLDRGVPKSAAGTADPT